MIAGYKVKTEGRFYEFLLLNNCKSFRYRLVLILILCVCLGIFPDFPVSLSYQTFIEIILYYIYICMYLKELKSTYQKAICFYQLVIS